MEKNQKRTQNPCYTYRDLENDLKQLTEEEKDRRVEVWREDSAFYICGLDNDKQIFYDDEDQEVITPHEVYCKLTEEEQSGYVIKHPNGVTVLIEDY